MRAEQPIRTINTEALRHASYRACTRLLAPTLRFLHDFSELSVRGNADDGRPLAPSNVILAERTGKPAVALAEIDAARQDVVLDRPQPHHSYGGKVSVDHRVGNAQVAEAAAKEGHEKRAMARTQEVGQGHRAVSARPGS